MLSLLDHSVVTALRENLPTKSGVLLFLVTNPKMTPEVRNTLSVSLPEGSYFDGSCWRVPSGDQIFIRSLGNKKPDVPYWDLVVCTGGEVMHEAKEEISSWRKRDAS
jgi:hypothetical protein